MYKRQELETGEPTLADILEQIARPGRLRAVGLAAGRTVVGAGRANHRPRYDERAAGANIGDSNRLMRCQAMCCSFTNEYDVGAGQSARDI